MKLNKKGFTLVELLVVIAIIGILIGIGVPRFIAATESARKGTFEANHRLYISAVAMYIADYAGATPRNKADLVPYLTTSEMNNTPSGATYDLTGDGNMVILKSALVLRSTTYTLTFTQ